MAKAKLSPDGTNPQARNNLGKNTESGRRDTIQVRAYPHERLLLDALAAMSGYTSQAEVVRHLVFGDDPAESDNYSGVLSRFAQDRGLVERSAAGLKPGELSAAASELSKLIRSAKPDETCIELSATDLAGAKGLALFRLLRTVWTDSPKSEPEFAGLLASTTGLILKAVYARRDADTEVRKVLEREERRG